ncbi:hypothetical protein K2O51_31750 (plasmid) [Cupriavidus pinatubonensis]|uniref:hypothetical protein n=1 Tax=Cupriavidus pinatubonensis TaxID=248026 RepID=UPI001C7376B3|nr:hypothetical protein [Cupriavidus pinatubonensis]QYY33601.1 hypothetical protein K2O51_31750 [Cupriavidus pinatubonensis]
MDYAPDTDDQAPMTCPTTPSNPPRALIAAMQSLLGPSWSDKVAGLGQQRALMDRQAGKRFHDARLGEAFIQAILTGTGAPWGRVRPALDDVRALLRDYDPSYWPTLNDGDSDALYACLKGHHACGQRTRRMLRLGMQCLQVLHHHAGAYGSLEAFLADRLKAHHSSVIGLLRDLGTPGPYKLPGMRVAIAAEALKNAGFDTLKPDLHIRRFAACLGIFAFRRWDASKPYGAPPTSEGETIRLLVAMHEFAVAAGVSDITLDNLAWLVCSSLEGGGFHLPNQALRKLGQSAGLLA